MQVFYDQATASGLVAHPDTRAAFLALGVPPGCPTSVGTPTALMGSPSIGTPVAFPKSLAKALTSIGISGAFPKALASIGAPGVLHQALPSIATPGAFRRPTCVPLAVADGQRAEYDRPAPGLLASFAG